MEWRVAKGLLKLKAQVDAKFPGRNTASDGSIGDAAHASRSSDHNPWVHDKHGQPIVTAIDITHDPKGGFDSYVFAEQLRQMRDPRIKYVISNRKIFSSVESPWQWRKYSGSNPHDHHVHISIKGLDQFFDDESPWHAPMLDGSQEAVQPAPVEITPDLTLIQQMINDKGFGPITVDNRLGSQTLRALFRVLTAVEKKNG